MGRILEVTPHKKKKKIDLNLCIICQSHNSSLEITKNILETSLVTLIDRCKKRRYYKGSKVTEFTDRIENISVVDIITQNGFYHRECYKTFSNLNEVKRTEKRFNSLNNDKQSAQTMLDRKVGRPSFKQGNQLEYEEQPMLRRSQSEPYNKKLCIICQIENKNILHCVQTLQMGYKMLSVAQKVSNKGFYRRLNTISAANDAPVNDVMYHNSCWVNAKRDADKTYETFSEKYYINVLSDVEIVHFVEKEMADPSGKVLDMNIINEIY